MIGGGVVGLAVARRLSLRHPGSSSSTVLLERRSAPGTETSSRNSEVVHAGIYYPAASLKTRLCVRGRQLLYEFCSPPSSAAAAGGQQQRVAHRKLGKWIVAQTAAQREALEGIAAHCAAIGVPVRWVGAAERARLEPDVRAEAGVLESPETGIVDAHGLMMALWGEFEEEGGGVTALNSEVVRVEPVGAGGGGGWELTVRDTSKKEGGEEETTTTITAEAVVNAAGLASAAVHNMAVDSLPASDSPTRSRLTMSYAKGNYFSYGHPSPKPGRLVYPAPEPGHGGLGTHLTLDLAGRVRFGPDVEWVDSPDDLAVNAAARLPEAVAEIRKYLPAIREEHLMPDYAGIRPKLSRQGAVAAGKGFVDFVVRRMDGAEGWVDLLGIESPGLTSSLAIAEMVEELLYG